MIFDWDEKKDGQNRLKHKIGFESACEFEWDTAVIIADTRHRYGESRWAAFGFLKGRLHSIVFTRRENKIRIISLRKANARERKRYESVKEQDT